MVKSHLAEVLSKAKYFIEKDLILLDIKASNGKRMHFIVGEYKKQVWIDKETLDFSCDCTWGSNQKDKICSHLVAALAKCTMEIGKKS